MVAYEGPEVGRLVVCRALEHVVADLEPLALVDDEGQRAVAAVRKDLRDGRHLGVGEVLLLVGEAHPGGGGREVALAVEPAVLEVRLLRDLGLGEVRRALDDERRLEAHLALHVEDDLHAVGSAHGVRRDLLELAGRV